MSRDPAQVCGQKSVYKTAAQASEALASIKRIANKKKQDCKVKSFYRCPACDLWHLTSLDKSPQDLWSAVKRRIIR